MSRQLIAHLSLSSVALIYGANYLIAKAVMPDPIGPNSFITLRVLGATILFWLIAFRKIQWPKKADLARFILCGLTGVAINQLLFFNGLSLTSPINSAIIMTSNPILVMIIAAVLLKQSITWTKGIGVLLGAVGASALLYLSAHDHSVHSSALGDVCILINSMSYAFYLVLVKPLMSKYSPLTVITWVFTIGLIAVTPFGGMGLSGIAWAELTAWQWFCIFFVIVLVTFMTYMLNIIALSIVSPTVSSAYIYFQPLLAGIFSFLFEGWTAVNYAADITWEKVLCTALIFIGVYLVGRSDLSLNKTFKSRH